MSEGTACANCGEPHGPDDVFCEACGFDFLTGSLPTPEAAPTSNASAIPPASSASRADNATS